MSGEKHENDQQLDHELDRALASMPELDVNEWARARIKRRALSAFEHSGGPRWLHVLECAYTFALEPALVFGVAPFYLLWALNTVFGIYGLGPR